jgi:hypothetical protein
VPAADIEVRQKSAHGTIKLTAPKQSLASVGSWPTPAFNLSQAKDRYRGILDRHF